MAQLGQNFDATTVEPNAPIELLPPGDYLAQIVQSEMRPTKNGSGQFLWLEMDILEEQYSGRKLWDRLNLVNPNQQAAEIAHRTLSAICHATGKMQVTDSEQLHTKPMLVTVKVKPAGKDSSGIDRDAQNEIKGYKAPGATSTARTAPARTSTSQQTETAKPSSSTPPPWRRAAG